MFAGQSNMMGTAFYLPTAQIIYRDSYEYLHKSRRMGESQGVFKKNAYPAGEFAYCNMERVYGKQLNTDAKSSLADFYENSFF